jgi:Sulfotransferase domain
VVRAMEDGATLLGDDYTEVRYEDLLERPEAETRRLFVFLGADASEKVVSRCVESASFEKRSGRERGQENYALAYGKHRKGIAGDWKIVFTQRDREIFKEVAGDL